MRWDELDSVMWCRELVRPGATAVDVGAHLGYYTRLFSRLVGTAGTVIAVEPNPQSFEMLRHNLRHHYNVQTVAIAAGDRECEGETVRARRLDDVLREMGIETVDFIKIDVEGGEPQVLRGLDGAIARSPNLKLMIRSDPAALRRASVEPEMLAAQIRASGLAVHAIEPDGALLSVTDAPPDRALDLLCWRKEA